MITLASLFDGISGFVLAGQRNGMTALWASEIEPFPIKVSSIRFPGMKQMGDITKIDCNNLDSVDIVTGGSPCQDLSVAGKRAGLAGERSGLFMEQIRIVREMRNADKCNRKTGEFIRPRFMVWENVPGAFSSNKGEDFRAVLEETARIADETVVIPGPAKGKWNTVGTIMGNGYSIAWRILDAQYWGVPQRRRRIFLVADFGGQSAPEILFKRKGLSRYIEESGETREGIATDAERSVGKTSRSVAPFDTTQITSPQNGNKFEYGLPCHTLNANAHVPSIVEKDTPKTMLIRCGKEGGGKGALIQDDKSATLSTLNIQTLFQPVAIENHPADSRVKLDESGTVQTLTTRMGTDGGNVPMLAVPDTKVFGICSYASNSMKSSNPHSGIYEAETSRTIDLNGGSPACNQGGMAIVQTYSFQRSDEFKETDKASTQSRRQYKDATDLVCSVDCRNFNETDKHGTLQAKGNGGQSLNYMGAVREGYSVRRLTPLECDRLQDYPDNWTNIPGASDSARYKADGNSIAVCCAEYVLEGIKKVLEVANEK